MKEVIITMIQCGTLIYCIMLLGKLADNLVKKGK